MLDCLSQLHDVLASFDEGIKSNEEGTWGDFPGVLSLSLVVVVGLLKLGAELHAGGELGVGVLRGFVLDVAKDLVAVDLLSALENDGVANLSDEDEQAGRCVVVL